MIFQSSPNLAAGCHKLGIPACLSVLHSVNPHPTLRLGATEQIDQILDWYLVSILTQPCGWVPLPSATRPSTGETVSILTQPCGWVPRRCSILSNAPQNGFNPHPTLRLGATIIPTAERSSTLQVSILTQPRGWLPRTCTAIRPRRQTAFIPPQPCAR